MDFIYKKYNIQLSSKVPPPNLSVFSIIHKPFFDIKLSNLNKFIF